MPENLNLLDAFAGVGQTLSSNLNISLHAYQHQADSQPGSKKIQLDLET
jgi:hypothetical protein